MTEDLKPSDPLDTVSAVAADCFDVGWELATLAHRIRQLHGDTPLALTLLELGGRVGKWEGVLRKAVTDETAGVVKRADESSVAVLESVMAGMELIRKQPTENYSA